MFARGLPHGRPARGPGTAGAAHLVLLALAFATLMYLGRQLWFFFDEWDVVGNPSLSLLAPHNEHWSTIPYLVYGALYPLFGLRQYAPYLAVTILLHVGVAHVLWRVMTSGGVRPWLAGVLTAVFLFLGAGAQNLVWAFQMGFVGSVFFGLVEVVLVDHDSRSGPREVAAWIAAAAALMCSDIGVVMVVMAGLTALFRRGARALLVTVVPPALLFFAWYATYGRSAQAAHQLPGFGSGVLFVYTGLSGAIGRATSLDRLHLGGIVLLALAAWGLYAARRLRRESPGALAGLATAGIFFVFVSLGRADLGADYSQSSRYLYVATAMLLPAAGLGLTALAGRRRGVEPLLVGLLLVSALLGANTLREAFHAQVALDLEGERHLLAAADLVGDRLTTISRVPEPHLAPQLDLARLAEFRRAGALPAEVGGAVPTSLDRELAQVQLQLALTASPRLPTVPGGARASTYQADRSPQLDGCFVITARGPAPELRLRSTAPFSIELRSAGDTPLGLGGAPDGAPVQVVTAPLRLVAGVPAYLNSVLVPGDITVGLPVGGALEACGVSFTPAP